MSPSSPECQPILKLNEITKENEMPLQNRVTPHGDIVAFPERGTMMGNRGTIHSADRTIGRRRWARKAWLCCRLDWKGIQRQVMGPASYTELFFLDEATALAAGHRPCNDCRREDLVRFCSAVGRAWGNAARTSAIDEALHADRVTLDGTKRRFEARLGELPDGIMFTLPAHADAAWLRWRGHNLRWSAAGYAQQDAVGSDAEVMVLTPRTTVDAIQAGYTPGVHPTADQ